MPLELGIAVSHAPGTYFARPEEWESMWQRTLSRGQPYPARVDEESGAKLSGMMSRIEAAKREVTRVFDAYAPEILIIIGGDQGEMFDRSNVPQFMIYLGSHGEGTRHSHPPAKVALDIDVEFSGWLLDRLVKQEGFDVAFSYDMQNLSGHREGLPHAFINPTAYLLQSTAPKVVLVYENTYDPPSLTARRCYEFGQAIAKLVRDDPRRIAILGSGGLAHDPGGRRAGWLDEPLDRWFLRCLAEGNGKATQAMFTFDSDTMISGTGEIRAWITVAGAMEELGAHATILDYVPGAKTLTGLGFAHWSAPAPSPAL